METNNHDKKIGVFFYEFLGTAFLMYALMMGRGTNTLVATLYGSMMYLAWNVSGGHFNPAITLGMYVS